MRRNHGRTRRDNDLGFTRREVVGQAHYNLVVLVDSHGRLVSVHCHNASRKFEDGPAKLQVSPLQLSLRGSFSAQLFHGHDREVLSTSVYSSRMSAHLLLALQSLSVGNLRGPRERIGLPLASSALRPSLRPTPGLPAFVKDHKAQTPRHRRPLPRRRPWRAGGSATLFAVLERTRASSAQRSFL